MPQYLAPGVYVEEVSSGVKPISGVGTNTAGFIGAVFDTVVMPDQPGKFETEPDPDNKGKMRPKVDEKTKALIPIPYKVAPALTPRLISGWEEFKNNFGDIQPANFALAHGVYGFLNNGGTLCWVTRVTDDKNLETIRAALDTFKAIDEISLVAIPNATDPDIQNAILDHCEDPFLQDRFAILDSQPVTDRGNLKKQTIQGGVRDSNYGAIYYPRIKVYDPVKDRENVIARRENRLNDLIDPHEFIGASGHLAGVYARVDETRGVYKAPANETIRGAVDVELAISKQEQSILNPLDINVLRKFDSNVVVWGAHTLGGAEDAEWKYISTRRLFLFLRKSIDKGTQWVVFEPNNFSLWQKIRRNITAFLTNVWRDGALFGNTPEEAFYVKCDASNNPEDVRALGQVIIEVGVAVSNPAEFVIIRISQWTGGSPQ